MSIREYTRDRVTETVVGIAILQLTLGYLMHEPDSVKLLKNYKTYE